MVYHLDELQYQCFSVDAYQKIFHHYNFTVKMKKPTSEYWSVTCYFAEVKQVYGKKFYLCWPVKSHDDGMSFFSFVSFNMNSYISLDLLQLCCSMYLCVYF